MRETKDTEFKREVSNSFLKTVSAYANYGDGRILFGVLDNGSECGIEDPVSACLNIENKINDGIDPIPVYTLSINEKNSVITLFVEEGIHKPYFYKSKAYTRNDAATVEVDRAELKRLILEGENSTFEEQKSDNQTLKFSILEKMMTEKVGVDSMTLDTLKTLELYDGKKGYNIAASLMADDNGFTGIDISRFGENINIILDRETFSGISILKQYSETIKLFQKYYEYDEIIGTNRQTKEMIPEAAFREVIANALVHRMWDIKAHINVSMFADRIEVTSPGGLPKGISREEYLRGGISIPRNYIVCNVFLRLKMIERFGTGIKRINDLYSQSVKKPKYLITDNSISVILPVISKELNLTKDSAKVYGLLTKNSMSSGEIANKTGFGKNKTIQILNELVEKGYVKKEGNGRGTKYRN